MTTTEIKTYAQATGSAALGLAIVIGPSLAFRLAQRELQKRYGLPAAVAFAALVGIGLHLWDRKTDRDFENKLHELLDEYDLIDSDIQK